MRTLTPIHKLQKAALRIISRTKHVSHHIPLCYSLKVLDLEDLYSVKALSFFHNYFHGILPPFFANKLSLYYSKDDELLLRIQYRRTDVAASSLLYTLPNIWNPLPSDIKKRFPSLNLSFFPRLKSII